MRRKEGGATNTAVMYSTYSNVGNQSCGVRKKRLGIIIGLTRMGLWTMNHECHSLRMDEDQIILEKHKALNETAKEIDNVLIPPLCSITLDYLFSAHDLKSFRQMHLI
jgi:hypothetical protein